jgi:tripartite-type tricarboxylate transporter receptor subunit TctC
MRIRSWLAKPAPWCHFSHAIAIAVSQIVFIVGIGASSASAQQDAYPKRHIRVLSPFAAGGLTDAALRPLVDKLSQSLGQPLIVENRPGASGLIAARACVGSSPDGYTICVLHNDAVLNAPFLFKTVGYDPARDLVPITNHYFNTAAFAVNASLKVNNLSELVALSKARPGGIKYASMSMMIRAFVDRFSEESGASLSPIPFKGGAEAMMAVVGGHVDAIFAGIGNLLPQIESGQVKVLAVEGASRSPRLPDVPTLKEAGFEVERVRNWFGFFAPAGTPAAIVEKLHDNIVAAHKDREFTNKTLIRIGLEPVLNSSSDFARFLETERVKAEREFKDAGVEPQ